MIKQRCISDTKPISQFYSALYIKVHGEVSSLQSLIPSYAPKHDQYLISLKKSSWILDVDATLAEVRGNVSGGDREWKSPWLERENAGAMKMALGRGSEALWRKSCA